MNVKELQEENRLLRAALSEWAKVAKFENPRQLRDYIDQIESSFMMLKARLLKLEEKGR